ncbi:single-stranded-DNA-specific exonuclease RecJ [Pseudomonadota bacterium]
MTGYEKKIIRHQLLADPAGLPEALHPVLRRIYAARGITRAEELEQGLERLLPLSQLKGVEQAAELLHRQLEQGGRILIVGDFDADGATSCALAMRALRLMGAAEVCYLVPNRFDYGYGLTPAIVVEALKLAPDLIVTVDNGISSLKGVAAANEAGVPVLVTDHHLPGDELPAAAAIVNPNQPGDTFPSKNLAGVGVIFYAMLALRTRLREQGWFEQRAIAEPNLAELLDLVALGTVADLVPLDHNNRILVQQGLRRIRAGRCCAGIEALLENARRNPRRTVASDLGFAVGPRLNAAGRLEDISVGIECLLSDDPMAAREIAQQLDKLNRNRRQIEGEMHQQALEDLDEVVPTEGELPFGLCLFNAEWHQGVVGILASRIKERYHRPVIAFAPAGNGMIKGSGRSVSGLHLRDALDAIATRHPGILERFGGHAMAAGMTLQEKDLDAFTEAFDHEVHRHLDADALQGVIHSDSALANDELNLGLAELLRDAGPWGQGFPEPVFDGQFDVIDSRIVGEHHLKLRLSLAGGGTVLDAIAFNQAEQAAEIRKNQIQIAYRLDVNEYRGDRNLQLVVEHIAPL